MKKSNVGYDGRGVVNRQVQCSNAIATDGTCGFRIICSSGVIVCAVPYVRQLVGAARDVRRARGRVVDRQVQCCNAIAAVRACCCKGVRASCIVVSAIPGVWQLVRAAGDVRGACRCVVNCQV